MNARSAPVVTLIATVIASALGCANPPTSAAKSAIEKAIDQQAAYVEIPLGQVLVRGEAQWAVLKKAETAGLVSVRDVPQGFWDSFLSQTQGTGTPAEVRATASLFQAIAVSPQEDQRVATGASAKAKSLRKLEQIVNAIDRYATAEGREPAELNALVPKYIDGAVLIDPWGKQYLYFSEPAPGFSLIGFTPDGKADPDLILSRGRGERLEGGTTRRVKLFDARLDKIVSDENYHGSLATPGEKHRLLLGTYRPALTEAARVVGPEFTRDYEQMFRFRCVIKYSEFSKQWSVVALDVGSLQPETWFTKNVV